MVWGIVGAGFGDMWASLHWCLRLAAEKCDRVQVSTLIGSPPTQERRRLEEMLSLIDAPDIELVDAPPTEQIGYECWKVRYFPTKRVWSPSSHIKGLISFQFDGRSTAAAKNPPRDDVEAFNAWIEAGGFNALRVGAPFSMSDCVDMLAMSEVFVGACSGMSTLALSVGVPTFVVAYKMGVSYWYGPNPHSVCADLPEFMKCYGRVDKEVHDIAGMWTLSDGVSLFLNGDGSALWSCSSHCVQGTWKGMEVRWANEFLYSFSLIGYGQARIIQHATDGSQLTCFATLNKP